jgi:hypothetical protein
LTTALTAHSIAVQVAIKGLNGTFSNLLYRFHVFQAFEKTSFICPVVFQIISKDCFGNVTTVFTASSHQYKTVHAALTGSHIVFQVRFPKDKAII